MLRLRSASLLCAFAVAACSTDLPTVGVPEGASLAVQGTASTRIPRPQLTLDSRTPISYIGGDGNTYLRYELSIKNSSSYPDALFAPAPQLPPCGLNANASRSWILIYDGNDTFIYGFCGFTTAEEMNQTWFAVREGDTPPSRVYITIWDRETNSTYTSNTIRIPN